MLEGALRVSQRLQRPRVPGGSPSPSSATSSSTSYPKNSMINITNATHQPKKELLIRRPDLVICRSTTSWEYLEKHFRQSKHVLFGDAKSFLNNNIRVGQHKNGNGRNSWSFTWTRPVQKLLGYRCRRSLMSHHTHTHPMNAHSTNTKEDLVPNP